jgi:hypothetical protein
MKVHIVNLFTSSEVHLPHYLIRKINIPESVVI